MRHGKKHLVIIFFRSDIRAGRNWQSEDQGFEDNLLDKGHLKIKVQLGNTHLTASVDVRGSMYHPWCRKLAQLLL